MPLRQAPRLLALLLLTVAAALAQVSDSAVAGIVSDPGDSHVPNVRVTLVNQATGVAYASATNEQGEYRISALPPGVYTFTAESAGFKRVVRGGLTLEVGRTFRVDVRLELGQVSESVLVTASVPLVDSESATIGQLVEQKSVVEMPLNGRRIGDLLALMGNAVASSGTVIRPNVMIAGGRGDSNAWLLDGVNASQMTLERSFTIFNPPVEAVQEFRIQQNAYSAEFGNTTGAVVSLVTRSGGNTFRGNAYEYFRNDALDARQFFAARKAPLRWNIYGFSVGGPIRRNRTFFFSNVEWQRQRIGSTQTLTLPTPAQRAGDFSNTVTAAGALVTIYDPDTTRVDPANPARRIRTPFPDNRIPANRIDPVGRALVGLYPLPNRAAANRAGASNFTRNSVDVLNITTWTAKVDHSFSDRDRLSVRYVLNDFPTERTPVFDEPAADPFAEVTDRRAETFMVNHVHTFSPSLLNDLRVNYQPRRFRALSLGLDQGWPSTLGLRGVSDRAFPRVQPTGFASMGSATQERTQRPIRDTSVVNVTSLFRGSHSLRFGGEARLVRNVEDLNSLISGRLGFTPQPTALPTVANTGNSIASLLLGLPDTADYLDTDEIDRRARYFALFAQDDWKLTPQLTLNLGLRWEAHTPRTDANNRQNGFNLLQVNPVSRTPGVVTFAGLDGLGSTVYDGDYNNLGPRIGLAWQPWRSRGPVLRAGYGVFFGTPVPGHNVASAGFESSGSFSTPDSGLTAPFRLSQGFPQAGRSPLGPGFGAVPVGSPISFSPQFNEQVRPLPYSQQWNLSVQQGLPGSILVEAAYLANVGHHLPGANTSINQVRPELMGPGNAQSRRPFPQFGNVTVLAPMWGNSSYHSLSLKIEKRFSQGLSFLSIYNWAKFIDDVPSGVEAGAVNVGMQNLYDRASEKALSGNDVRHRLVVSSVYELPVGLGRAWLSRGLAGRVLGGWNLSGVLTLQAGSPYGLYTQVNTTNAFTPGPQRVNLLRSPELPESEKRVERWFDTAAAVAPPAFTFGTAGRSILTGPGLANLDVALLKNHRWGERYNVQFRAEGFNIANRANFQEPGTLLGSPDFGVVRDTLPARVLQLGLKLEF